MPTAGATARDYYDVLGVPRDADGRTIKDAFRKLALRYHPDRNASPDAEARFKEIAEAYAVLSDEAKRRAYDTHGFAGVSGVTPEDVYAGMHLDDILRRMGVGLGGRGSIFEDLFGRGRARGADVRVRLEVALETIVRGGAETVRVVHPRACAECGGTGAMAGTSPRPCPGCGGSGQTVVRRRTGGKGRERFVFQEIRGCEDCRGRGRIVDRPCGSCAGVGRVEQAETLKVKIPVGAEDGLALRVPGRGLPGEGRDAPPGDLYVVVHAAPDARFERMGPHLWRVETLDVADLVLGTKLEVPALDGAVVIDVPAGTQPDQVLRLRGKGLPVFGGSGRGDLNVRVRARVPRRLSRTERALWEQLRAARPERGR